MSKVLYLIPFFCLLLCSKKGQSQEDFIPYKMAVKYSPTSLMPLPLSSVQFAFEHKLKNPQHAFQHEIGIPIAIPYNTINGDFRRMQGIKIIPTYRYYFSEPKPKFNIYTSLHYRFQYESWELTDWFNRDNGAYQQEYNYNKHVMSNGLLASIGGNRVAINSHFIFEWEVGFGTKARTVFNKKVPDDAEIISNTPFLFPNIGNQFNPTEGEAAETTYLPTFILSLKFGYTI